MSRRIDVKHIFASAVVRKIAYVLVAVVLSWIGMGRASATEPSYASCQDPNTFNTWCSTQSESVQIVTAHASAYRNYLVNNGTPNAQVCAAETLGPTTVEPYGPVKSYRVRVSSDAGCTAFAVTYIRSWVVSEACPGGYQKNSAGQCMDEQACKAMSPLGQTFASGGDGTTCHNGCKFKAPDGVKPVGIKLGSDNYFTWITTGDEPTGESCSASPNEQPEASGPTTTKPPETKEVCKQMGTQTACIKPDGQVCSTATANKEICWKPGEVGEKTEENVLQKRDPGDTVKPPTVPPGDTLVLSGDALKTETKIGDRSATTTTQNYVTGSGNNAGTKDSGTKTGTGAGSGTCDPKTGCKPGKDEGPGAAGPGPGSDMYSKTDKTVASVYGDFKTRVSGSSFGSAATGFIGTCQGGGSCPTATWTSSEYGISFSLAELCMGVLASILTGAGWVFLAGAAIYAFKVAIL